MAQIESVQNERIKSYSKLKEKKYRDQSRQFLVEGEHLIQEALLQGLVDLIFYVDSHEFDYMGECLSVSQAVMDKLSVNVSKVNYIAVCHFMEQQEVDRKRVLLLDGVQDPGNVGTIIRSALSFGFDQVVLSEHSIDVYNEKLIRSTQGALFQLPIVRGDILWAIEQLHQEGFVVYATAFEDAKSLQEIASQEKMAFVMGNEGQGVSQAVLDVCDERIFIEMCHFDSLNVAIASGILLYQFRRN